MKYLGGVVLITSFERSTFERIILFRLKILLFYVIHFNDILKGVFAGLIFILFQSKLFGDRKKLGCHEEIVQYEIYGEGREVLVKSLALGVNLERRSRILPSFSAWIS